MEVSTSVEERVDTVMVEQLPKTQFDNSKAPDFHLSGMLALIQMSVRIRLRLQVKASQVTFSRILVEVIHQSPSRVQPGGSDDYGETNEDGTVMAVK